MGTCQPVLEAWNQGCDSDEYPTSEQTRAWKPMQPYPAPEVGRLDTVRDTNHIPPTNFRGYHTEMNEDTKACLKWLEEEIEDDYIAHWEGNTVESAKSAVVKAYLRVLHNLPTRPDEDPGDTFGFQQWMEGIRRAPRGSGAGGDGTRPDLIAELVHHSSDFADALYGYHSYMAHGPPGTGNCTQLSRASCNTTDGPGWCTCSRAGFWRNQEASGRSMRGRSGEGSTASWPTSGRC